MSKNIKISDFAHEKLTKKKKPGESFDEVIKRLLGLERDLDDLTAFYSEEVRETAKDLVNFIDSNWDLEQEIKEGKNRDTLFFLLPDNQMRVVEIHFLENLFNIWYRDKSGSMSPIDKGEIESHQDVSEEKVENIKEELEKKVTGSINRWSD